MVWKTLDFDHGSSLRWSKCLLGLLFCKWQPGGWTAAWSNLAGWIGAVTTKNYEASFQRLPWIAQFHQICMTFPNWMYENTSRLLFDCNQMTIAMFFFNCHFFSGFPLYIYMLWGWQYVKNFAKFELCSHLCPFTCAFCLWSNTAERADFPGKKTPPKKIIF